MRFRTKIFEQEFFPIANSVSLRPYTKSKLPLRLRLVLAKVL